MRISDLSSDVGSSDLFSYEEAAEICGCAVGTVKSRVARARVALEKNVTEGGFTESTEGANLSDPHAAILASVDRLSGPADIGRAHVWTPVTNAQLVCRRLLVIKKLPP